MAVLELPPHLWPIHCVGSALDDLWGHILWSAAHRAHGISTLLGQTKVSNLHLQQQTTKQIGVPSSCALVLHTCSVLRHLDCNLILQKSLVLGDATDTSAQHKNASPQLCMVWVRQLLSMFGSCGM